MNRYRKDGCITGVPEDLFPYVKEFCRNIVNDRQPIYVDVKPEPSSVINECFLNVDEMIKKNGGEKILGWQIWEWFGVMIEAEFHAIWLSPNNEFIDITPKALPFDKILFLQDPEVNYEEKQINNIRKTLVKDDKVEEFIQITNRIFDILNCGDRATQRSINLSDKEKEEYENLKIKMLYLQIEILNTVPERNNLCRCGFGRKFKKCHGNKRP